MIYAGLALLTVGSVGICAAVALEIRYREKKFLIMMKVAPWLIGIGGLLMGLAIK